MDPRNPAVKRLIKELDEVEADEHRCYSVHPVEVSHDMSNYLPSHHQENFFEWHFTLDGPSESPYAGGKYHGVIRFPPDYPFAPPNVSFLTPSGRFQTSIKICLSITGYHPEHWQPAWGVRTLLIALRDYFGNDDRSSIGHVAASEEMRRDLAQRSREFECRLCGYSAGKEEDEAGTVECKVSAQDAQLKSQSKLGSLPIMLIGTAVIALIVAFIKL